MASVGFDSGVNWLEGLNEENAEELFIEDYQDDSGRVGEYRYGFYLMTYLTETYGEDTLKEFFGVLNGKHLCDELFYSDMICDNLKEMYGENIFTEFGKWYVANKEKYYWDER